MFKSLKDYYKESLTEQEYLIKELYRLLEDNTLDSLLKIIQFEPTRIVHLKMLDLLHDKNRFLDILESNLNEKVKEISPIFKVKKTNYHTLSFYVREDVGSLFLLGEYDIQNNTFKSKENFLMEKEKISQKYKNLEKTISKLKDEKDFLKFQSHDLNKLSIILKKDQKIKGDIYTIEKKLNKNISERKNFHIQYTNLYFLFKNMHLYYRLQEMLKSYNICVNETLFLATNEYNVFLYKEPQENNKKTIIAKRYTNTHDNLITSDVVTSKVFISLENFIRNLPEGTDYIKGDNYIDIELDFTNYRFYEHGLIVIDNIYGNIYDLFEMNIFEIIELSCNSITSNENKSYL